MSPGHPMFSKLQTSELREMAISITDSRKWDELPWCDAWNGTYPIRPSDSEVEREFSLLQKKATRIIGGGTLESEYLTMDEHCRMIYLESAQTFSLYRANESS